MPYQMHVDKNSQKIIIFLDLNFILNGLINKYKQMSKLENVVMLLVN